MARSDGRRSRLDAEEVLADRARPRPSAEDLAELIRRTNPTGLGLAPAEERRRYALKSKLQSLLLRRHAELVAVSSADGEIVDISLAGTGQHAAHAPLDELDEDVRAWVRRQLDVGAAAPERPAPSARRAPAATDDPLTQARIARERGALDEARAILERARSRGAARAERIAQTVALLDLLVDALWNDAAALEVGAALAQEPDVLAHPSVRGPLALAAARQGDVARAREHLGRTSGAFAAAAWAELGLRAMAVRDGMSIAEAADALGRLEPSHPLLLELRDALRAIRASERLHAEAKLRERLESAPDDETRERLARDHLRRWPSDIARAALAAITAARRATRIAELLMRADAEPDDALRVAILRTARTEGAVDVEDRIASLEAKLQLQADAAARAVFERDLGSDDPVRILVAWREAPAHIRAGHALPVELERASVLAAHASLEDHAPAAAAAAALAHRRADAALERGDHVAADRSLAEVGALADELAGATGLRAAIGRAAEVSRHTTDAATITLAEAAYARGEHDEALRVLGALSRTNARGLAERIEAARARRRAEAEFADAAAREEPERAHAIAERLARDAPEHDRARWTAEIERLRSRIALRWRFEVADGSVSCADAVRSTEQHVERSVSPDGRQLAVVEGAGGWWFVRLVDIDLARVVRHAMFRDPRTNTGAPVRVHFESNRIRWAADTGDIYSVAADLSRFAGVARVRPPRSAETLEEIVPVPGRETVWRLVHDRQTGRFSCEVIDLESGSVVRDAGEGTSIDFVPGERPRIARISGSKMFLHGLTGAGAVGADFGPRCQPLAAASWGSGLYLVLYEQEDEGEDELALRWRLLEPVRGTGTRWGAFLGASTTAAAAVIRLGGSAFAVSFGGWDGSRLAGVRVLHEGPITSREHGEAVAPFLVKWRASEDDDVADAQARALIRADAARADGHPIEWEISVPRELVLATTVDGTHPIAATFDRDGVRIVRLGIAGPPRLHAETPRLDADLVSVWALPPRPRMVGERLRSEEDRLAAPPPSLLDEVTLAPAALLERAAGLAVPERERVLRTHHERHPSQPYIAAALAEAYLRKGALAEATALVDGPLAEVPDPGLRLWVERARALLRVQAGDIDGAQAAWRRCLATPAIDDDLQGQLETALAAYDTGPGTPSALSLCLDAIEEHDRCRARGDLLGATAALDTALAWTAYDMHLLTRLADTWLERAPTTASERFERTRVLCELVGASNLTIAARLPPRRDIWSEARRADVIERAQRALDESEA